MNCVGICWIPSLYLWQALEKLFSDTLPVNMTYTCTLYMHLLKRMEMSNRLEESRDFCWVKHRERPILEVNEGDQCNTWNTSYVYTGIACNYDVWKLTRRRSAPSCDRLLFPSAHDILYRYLSENAWNLFERSVQTDLTLYCMCLYLFKCVQQRTPDRYTSD